jgi:hypothetical protein
MIHCYNFISQLWQCCVDTGDALGAENSSVILCTEGGVGKAIV